MFSSPEEGTCCTGAQEIESGMVMLHRWQKDNTFPLAWIEFDGWIRVLGLPFYMWKYDLKL